MSDVAIIMGSDSDWPIMEEAAKTLEKFSIKYSAEVLSAHRMPTEMVEFAQGAQSAGYKVIIAGAGGAAHLPGMVASLTTLPVIGVPISLKNLDGMDSLYQWFKCLLGFQLQLWQLIMRQMQRYLLQEF